MLTKEELRSKFTEDLFWFSRDGRYWNIKFSIREKLILSSYGRQHVHESKIDDFIENLPQESDIFISVIHPKRTVDIRFFKKGDNYE